MSKLGDIVLYDAQDGNQYPGIVSQVAAEGGTVGLLVFAPKPFYLANHVLKVDESTVEEDSAFPTADTTEAATSATPIGDSLTPPSP